MNGRKALGLFLAAVFLMGAEKSCWGAYVPLDGFSQDGTALVEGYAWSDSNNNGGIDDNEARLANTALTIYSEPYGTADAKVSLGNVVTNSAGGFSKTVALPSRPPGDFNQCTTVYPLAVYRTSNDQLLSKSFSYRVLESRMESNKKAQKVCLNWNFRPNSGSTGFLDHLGSLRPSQKNPPATGPYTSGLVETGSWESLVRAKVKGVLAEKYAPFRVEFFDCSGHHDAIEIRFRGGCFEYSRWESDCGVAGVYYPPDDSLDVGNRENDNPGSHRKIADIFLGGVVYRSKFGENVSPHVLGYPNVGELAADLGTAIGNVAAHELGHALGAVPEEWCDSDHGHNYSGERSRPKFVQLAAMRSSPRKVMNSGGLYACKGSECAYKIDASMHLKEISVTDSGARLRVRVPMRWNQANKEYLRAILEK